MQETLTDDNFIKYCALYYDNPQCHGDDEFLEDLMRLKYIKKLCTRFIESGDLKERLILNHIVVLSNVFPPMALCKIFWLKMPEYLKYIKPFLIFLDVLPDRIYNVRECGEIDTTAISMDQKIIDHLRKI
jgi:hypothetical protein